MVRLLRLVAALSKQLTRQPLAVHAVRIDLWHFSQKTVSVWQDAHARAWTAELAARPAQPLFLQLDALARLVLLSPVMNTIRTIGALSLCTAGLLFACEHTYRGEATTASAGTNATGSERVGVPSVQAANADAAIVEQLATARCDREQTCNNIGGGQKYASRSVCMEQMRGSIANDLNAYNCPRGIDRNEVGHCVTAIKSEECGNPLDTLARMEKCRTTPMCMK
jgi:hypothetical protein